MKILISESQHKRIFKEEKEQKVLRIPSLKIFDENILVAWNILQKFLEKKGNPPYTLGSDLYLADTPIKSLGNLQSVGGNINLGGTPIESLGNLTSVGGNINLYDTPLSEKYTEKQIRKMVNVDGEIYL
jgi:hypothetical protein